MNLKSVLGIFLLFLLCIALGFYIRKMTASAVKQSDPVLDARSDMVYEFKDKLEKNPVAGPEKRKRKGTRPALSIEVENAPVSPPDSQSSPGTATPPQESVPEITKNTPALKKEEPPLQKKQEPPVKKNGKKNIYVQAGSFPDLKDASILKKKLESALDDVNIQRTEITGKGVWYRVRIGPLDEAGKDAAVEKLIREFNIKPWVKYE